MIRAPSALVLIGGFGVAVATLSVAATATIVLLAPQPPALPMSAAAAIVALRAGTPGYERRVVTVPPRGVRASLLEQMIAAELRRPPADVRAVWLEGEWPKPLRSATQRIRIPESELKAVPGAIVSRPTSFVLVGRPSGSYRMYAAPTTSGAMRRTFINLPMPAFVASVRRVDGRWLSVQPVQPLLSGWQLNVLIALAVSLLLLAPFAWLFARHLTRPFRALAGVLGNTAEAVPMDGPRELREAAAAIAAMRTSLAAESTERARMLTAIAHDLRTPLTSLRLRIEASPEPQRARMVADVERMQAMIGEVLGFARDAAELSERVAVRSLLTAIIDDMDVAGRRVLLAPGEEVEVAVPAPAFRRVMENLLRNAIDYAGGGTIELRREDKNAIMSVTDAGPGIPAADRERLLRPFERGEVSRNRGTGGAGLGLSIVRDFAAQHRGDFNLSHAVEGGLQATLRLPVA